MSNHHHSKYKRLHKNEIDNFTRQKRVPISPAIRKLYPELSEDELRVAQENLDRYAALIARMRHRMLAEKAAAEEMRLTLPSQDGTQE